MKITKVIERLIESRRPRSEPSENSHPFEGVAIVPLSGSCPKAHELARTRRRFLAGEAPTLPLPECIHPESCGCHFATFADRRLTERREVAFSPSRCYAGPERRRTAGRRSSDR
jgi:hypothetical protein